MARTKQTLKRARVNDFIEQRERFAKLQRVSALPTQMPDVDTVEGALHRIRLACAVVVSYLETY